MTQLGVVGNAPQAPKQVTITERLISVRVALRGAHQRLDSTAARAGLLTPTPQTAGKDQPECSDLHGIVGDLENLCERLMQDCNEVEKIA